MFFEAGIKYFFMVQYNVSSRYTFAKKLFLLRVEETEFSLSTALRVEKLTPLTQNLILHVICSHIALL